VEPDPAHGPHASASMLAGPVTDTIAHSDDRGERVTVSPGASKADQVERRLARLSNALKEPRGGKPDPLILIKGIGPVNEKKLNEHGIFHFDQVAAWQKADIEAAEAYLEFDGRIEREDWIGQAKVLAEQAASAEATDKNAAGVKPAPDKSGGSK
jgi:branched-chain amino acid transport system ATP-binding protein